jgi:hypothetical protein
MEKAIMNARGVVAFIVLTVASTATNARAEWVVAPYLGVNLAGDAEFRFLRATVGVTLRFGRR